MAQADRVLPPTLGQRLLEDAIYLWLDNQLLYMVLYWGKLTTFRHRGIRISPRFLFALRVKFFRESDSIRKLWRP